MRLATLAVSLLLSGSLIATSLASADSVPSLSSYTADQIQAMSTAPATYAGDTVDGISMTPAQVQSAVTDNSSSEGSLTGNSMSGPSGACWFTDKLWTEWGIWPFQQRITEWRY